MNEANNWTMTAEQTVTHTPGPWRYYPKYGDDHAEDDGFVVLRSVPRDDGGRTITVVADEVFSEPDAKLIAAAPDLLDAARNLIACWDEDWSPGQDLETHIQYLRESAQKALGNA